MLSGGRVRGYPLIQTVLMFLCFALAGYPVWRLTRPAPIVAAAPLLPVAHPGPETLEIEADFVPAPADFEVSCPGAVVIEAHGSAETQFKKSWTANVPKEGVDLIFRAHWPAAGLSAARLIVQSPDGTKVEKSFWTAPGAALEEVVTVPGN